MYVKLITLLLIVFAQSAAAFSQDIFEAARTGDIKRIEQLSKLKADTVNAVNARGFNPLMIACYRGKEKAARLLVKKGANVNSKSPEGNALQAASYQNNVPLAAFLIKHGAELNVAAPDGNNALMYAVMNQNEKMVQLLVNSGADLKAQNKDGQTASSLAMTMSNTRIQEWVKINH